VFEPTIDEYTHLLFFSLLTCVRFVLDELLRCHRLGRDIPSFTLFWCATLKRLLVQYKRACMQFVWVLLRLFSVLMVMWFIFLGGCFLLQI